jgi:hypothetical protein
MPDKGTVMRREESIRMMQSETRRRTRDLGWDPREIFEWEEWKIQRRGRWGRRDWKVEKWLHVVMRWNEKVGMSRGGMVLSKRNLRRKRLESIALLEKMVEERLIIELLWWRSRGQFHKSLVQSSIEVDGIASREENHEASTDCVSIFLIEIHWIGPNLSNHIKSIRWEGLHPIRKEILQPKTVTVREKDCIILFKKDLSDLMSDLKDLISCDTIFNQQSIASLSLSPITNQIKGFRIKT